jgi:hypothetical protein
MPRYRIAFAREWTLGRWGFLDRFFHDLGGHQSEPSGLDNSWIVEYRGQARHLGREIAKELNIQANDYRKFGPIFEIEEVPGQRPASRRNSANEPPTDARSDSSAETPNSPGTAAQTPDSNPGAKPTGAAKPTSGAQNSTAEPQGPSWLANMDVEDAAITEPVDTEGDPSIGAFPGSIPGGAGDAMAASAAAARAQSRFDDLFRIRQRDATGRRRADAIAGASRRRVAPEPPPTE